MRIDRVVLRHLRHTPGLSRNRIQKLIDSGGVLINGTTPPRAAWRIQPGDDVRVHLEPAQSRARPIAQPIELDVLFEDEAILAINKPPGLVVHPSYKHTNGTLINGVFERAKRWQPGSRPMLLGRLDKQTSGIVIVTKLPAVHAALQRAMDARRVEKDYTAIVWGKPSPSRGSIDLALNRDPWDRRKVTVTDRGGQPSITKYERLSTSAGLSLVRCRLVTGRMHQIRVHLSARGWPLVGDRVYGRDARSLIGADVRREALAFPRQALHASRVSFQHPLTRSEVDLVAPMPEDMRALLAIIAPDEGRQ